jgi:predicted PurR-regulated permease PerM
MNIISQELKSSFKSFLSYSVIMLALMYVFLLLFETVRDKAEILDQVLSNFPPEFMPRSALRTSACRR